MKKVFMIFILIILLLKANFAYASNIKKVEGTIVNFPVYEDFFHAENYVDISQVLIDGRVYVPLRDICEVMEIDVEWVEYSEYEKCIFLLIDRMGVQTRVNLNISEETALKIAEAIFEASGEDFLNRNPDIYIEESDDGTCFMVMRYEKSRTGGGMTLYISKKDGKVVKIAH